MIRKARTDSERLDCKEYLRSRGLECVTDSFLYYREEYAITGVAGLVVGECDNVKVGYIEPFICENTLASLKLYTAAEGFMIGKNCDFVIVGCSENESNENMYEKLGYKKWSDKFNQYAKKL